MTSRGSAGPTTSQSTLAGVEKVPPSFDSKNVVSSRFSRQGETREQQRRRRQQHSWHVTTTMILLRRTGFVAAGARRSCYRCYSSLSLLFLVFGATTPTGGAVPSGGSSESYYPRHCCGSIAAAVTGAGHSRRGATCFVGPATAPRRLSFSNKNISSEQRTRSSQLATSTGQMSSSTSLSASDRKLVVDPFCYRQ